MQLPLTVRQYDERDVPAACRSGAVGISRSAFFMSSQCCENSCHLQVSIISGYRHPRCSLVECVKSTVAPLNNETVNFWTHFIPFWCISTSFFSFFYYFHPQVLCIPPRHCCVLHQRPILHDPVHHLHAYSVRLAVDIGTRAYLLRHVGALFSRFAIQYLKQKHKRKANRVCSRGFI